MKHQIVQKQNPIMLVLAIAQTLLLLTIAIQLSGMDGSSLAKEATKTGDTQVAAPSAADDTAPAAAPTVDMSKFTGHTEGADDAPVTIVEWSDFECPYCGRFYSQTLGSIRSDYVDSGKVKIIFKNFPLSFHPQAQKAAEAAECAGDQDMFWEMHDMLFEKGVTGGVDSFKQFAADLGLDTQKFNTCLDSGEKASITAADQAEGVANGITGTPGFIINGQKVSGAQPYAVFQQVIEAALN
ncbi:MAG: DsbA family protein [Nanoarchaeota archaeon]|nr:DsbA family protein [Nanoarchaeota archaeon]